MINVSRSFRSSSSEGLEGIVVVEGKEELTRPASRLTAAKAPERVVHVTVVTSSTLVAPFDPQQGQNNLDGM